MKINRKDLKRMEKYARNKTLPLYSYTFRLNNAKGEDIECAIDPNWFKAQGIYPVHIFNQTTDKGIQLNLTELQLKQFCVGWGELLEIFKKKLGLHHHMSI
jgi:hypothetical protein